MKRFKVDPYFVTVEVYTDVKAYKRRYKKLNCGHENSGADDCAGQCGDFGSTQLVGVFSGGLDTLAHELVHATLNICESRSIKPFKDQEPLAFMLGKLIGDIYQKMPDVRSQDTYIVAKPKVEEVCDFCDCCPCEGTTKGCSHDIYAT